MAEYLLVNAIRSRQRFRLSYFFEGVKDDTRLNIIDAQTRVYIRRKDGKRKELDIVAESRDGRVVLVEVRNRQSKATLEHVQDFQEKIHIYQSQNPDAIVLPAFLCLGGFNKNALTFCQTEGIAWSTELERLS